MPAERTADEAQDAIASLAIAVSICLKLTSPAARPRNLPFRRLDAGSSTTMARKPLASRTKSSLQPGCKPRASRKAHGMVTRPLLMSVAVGTSVFLRLID